MKKISICFIFLAIYSLGNSNLNAQKIDENKNYREVKRFDAYYARQGVAVDKHHLYAIDNNHITKFTLNGDSITTWYEPDKNRITHINSGVVLKDKLYCAHSNYPEIPMASSIEIFDTKSMNHIQSISIGIDVGSCVWIASGKRCWYVFFAHYDGGGKQPGCDVSWSQLVQFDLKWRRMQAWILPNNLIQEIRPASISSGIFLDGVFYCMGHDQKKCYLLTLPNIGVHLQWVATINVPIKGQAISIDSDGNIWGIDRRNRQVIEATQK